MPRPPNPNPTPSPTPVPTSTILIDSITATVDGAILTFDSTTGVDSAEVSQEFIDKCEPEVGGYFVTFNDSISYLSATNFSARFPQ